MGWTSFYVGKGYSNKQRQAYLDRQFTWKPKDDDGNAVGENEVLKSAMVGSTYYAAVHIKRYDGTLDKVIGVVTLTRLEDGEFFYKDMSEDSGPYECKCPKGILNLLTPLDDSQEFAKAWRERCNEYHKKNSSENKAKPGDIYECTSSYDISWDYATIKKGEKFFVKYCDYGKRRKYYLVAVPSNLGYSTTNRRLMLKTFNSCEHKLIQRG